MPYILATLLVCCLASCTLAPTAPCPEAAAASFGIAFMVRHAEKVLDGSPDPDLSAAGHARAQRLAAMLGEAGISAIYSTPYRRTQQTAAPLAQLLGIDIQTYEARDSSFLARVRALHEGEHILIVGHSNTIPALANEMTGTDTHPELDEAEYDKIFMATTSGDTATVLKLVF